jgi:putative hydrolase of the HAD superfamily
VPNPPDFEAFRAEAASSIADRPFIAQSIPFEKRLQDALSATRVELDAGRIEELAGVFFEPVEASLTLPADTIPTLQEIRGRGYRLALVSNTPWGSSSRVWRRALDRFSLTGYFDVIAFSSEVGWRKPSREIFEWVTSRLEVAAEDCVFVGDSPKEDIEGAVNIGMRAVLKRTPRCANQPLPGDVAEINRLGELLEVLGAASRTAGPQTLSEGGDERG